MVQRERPGSREDRLKDHISLPAIPQGVTSLKSGAVSAVFHIPFEHAERAFSIHELQGKSVTLRIEVDE